jgi:acyl-CoA synthetase (AMP-forming)/AMP-acid ligase II
MTEYLFDPEKTAEAFAGGWMHSGAFVRVSASAKPIKLTRSGAHIQVTWLLGILQERYTSKVNLQNTTLLRATDANQIWPPDRLKDMVISGGEVCNLAPSECVTMWY